MRRNLFFAFMLVLGFGLTLSSCAPGVYTSVGYGPGYYGSGYYGSNYYGRPYGYGYGPGYYGRPIIVAPRTRAYGGYRGDVGFHGGGGYRGGYGGGFHGGGGYGGGRRGGR